MLVLLLPGVVNMATAVVLIVVYLCLGASILCWEVQLLLPAVIVVPTWMGGERGKVCVRSVAFIGAIYIYNYKQKS